MTETERRAAAEQAFADALHRQGIAQWPPPGVLARVVALLMPESERLERERKEAVAELVGILDADLQPTTVYRVFDDTGQLLYVGITSRGGLSRLREHEHRKPWWRQADRVDVEHFKSRTEALLAEWWAIQLESPLFNIAGRPTTR